MRLLTATVITSSEKTGLKLRLESGLITFLPYDKLLSSGQEILISYDFTKSKINPYKETQ